MAGRECYHCKQWIQDGEPHDCWTTTEAALTGDLAEDLKDAWERLREVAGAFGEQRIYASHNSIMFSRKSCYFFVRPKRTFLEVCIFLPRTVHGPQVRRSVTASRTKIANMLQIRHRDEVEAPITNWLEEAFAFSGMSAQTTASNVMKGPPARKRPAAVPSARAKAAVKKRMLSRRRK